MSNLLVAKKYWEEKLANSSSEESKAIIHKKLQDIEKEILENTELPSLAELFQEKIRLEGFLEQNEHEVIRAELRIIEENIKTKIKQETQNIELLPELLEKNEYAAYFKFGDSLIRLDALNFELTLFHTLNERNKELVRAYFEMNYGNIQTSCKMEYAQIVWEDWQDLPYNKIYGQEIYTQEIYA